MMHSNILSFNGNSMLFIQHKKLKEQESSCIYVCIYVLYGVLDAVLQLLLRKIAQGGAEWKLSFRSMILYLRH